MPISLLIALELLKSNPQRFLTKYPIRIFGDVKPSSIETFFIEHRGDSFRPGALLGTHNFHNVESFNIRPASSRMAKEECKLFAAHSISMSAGRGKIVATYKLDESGPNIMVTGQLSGCAFLIQTKGRGLEVSHIKPVGISGADLATTLGADHPDSFVYGVSPSDGFYDSCDRVVSIIGVRKSDGHWAIYAQKQDALTMDYRIRSVYMIYPEYVKIYG